METQRFAIRSRAFPLNYWSAGSVLGAATQFPGILVIQECHCEHHRPATKFADFFEAAVKAMPE